MGVLPDSGIPWLVDMRRSATELNYQGFVVYAKDQQLDTFKLVHANVDGQEKERLIALNSPLREVVRTAGNVSFYSAQDSQVVVETKPSNHSVLLELPDDPTVLSRYYRVGLRGQEYIAGRLSQVVALEPKDPFRYTRIIWVDTESKLPLKLEVINEAGQSVEQMVFVSIVPGASIASRDFEPTVREGRTISSINHRESTPLDDLNWSLRDVPDGFQIVSYFKTRRTASNTLVEHILLSDGFAPVSVYIEKNTGSKVSKERKAGAINIESLTTDGYVITVMGEVPVRTVQIIAKGIRLKKSGSNTPS